MEPEKVSEARQHQVSFDSHAETMSLQVTCASCGVGIVERRPESAKEWRERVSVFCEEHPPRPTVVPFSEASTASYYEKVVERARQLAVDLASRRANGAVKDPGEQLASDIGISMVNYILTGDITLWQNIK
jgi:hypothetical protein